MYFEFLKTTKGDLSKYEEDGINFSWIQIFL